MSPENEKRLSLLCQISPLCLEGIKIIHYGKSNHKNFKYTFDEYNSFKTFVGGIVECANQLKDTGISGDMLAVHDSAVLLPGLVRGEPSGDGYYHLTREEIDKIVSHLDFVISRCDIAAKPLFRMQSFKQKKLRGV